MRIDILEMLAAAGSGHPGGSLSAIDIVVCLYFHQLRYRVDDPDFHARDHFILSKGHACPAQYACLAEAGYFSRDQLTTLRKLDSMLQGHPDMHYTPGVEMSTGSLGQGLSVAGGMALALKRDGSDRRVYVLMGDGESQEGMVWEAAMSAPRLQLDNLTAILDHNGIETDGWVEDLVGLEPIVDRYRSFGWAVFDVDGHDHGQILEALDEASRVKGQPSFIRARTVKGKGVSFMENNHKFHGVAPSPEQLQQALAELGAVPAA
jgi:transketolase